MGAAEKLETIHFGELESPFSAKKYRTEYGYAVNDPINTIDTSGLRIVVQGTLQQQAQIWKAIAKNRASCAGELQYQTLNNSDIDYTIRFADELQDYLDFDDVSGGSKYSSTSHVIRIVLSDIGRSIPGGEPSGGAYTLERIIAHELGHAMGAHDDGPGKMNNVKTWENPISTPIDGYIRTRYER